MKKAHNILSISYSWILRNIASSDIQRSPSRTINSKNTLFKRPIIKIKKNSFFLKLFVLHKTIERVLNVMKTYPGFGIIQHFLGRFIGYPLSLQAVIHHKFVVLLHKQEGDGTLTNLSTQPPWHMAGKTHLDFMQRLLSLLYKFLPFRLLTGVHRTHRQFLQYII